MIWVDGRVVAVGELRISVLDQTFEHGLGLFETLRTWNGRAPLLGRHMVRLTRSAHALGLPIQGVRLPDADAVADLLRATDTRGDVVLRITLTGGLSSLGGATLWMRTLPLPTEVRHGGATIELGSWWVRADDELARHKSLNYWSRRRAYERAQAVGFDETLSSSSSELAGAPVVWEGSRTNVFAVSGETLMTPCLDGPLVAGVMRGVILERARELPLRLVEEPGLPFPTLLGADEVFLVNSVRGVVPVGKIRALSRTYGFSEGTAPGSWTQRLGLLVHDWLEGGDRP